VKSRCFLRICRNLAAFTGASEWRGALARRRKLRAERGEQKRISNARKALVAPYLSVNLQTELAGALHDMDWCRQIRNQYAHCQWYWTAHEGLCFVDLEAVAKQVTPITELTKNKLPINLFLWATSAHSINSSALASKEGGTVRPSALAVFILITSSNLVGCSTGRSASVAPGRQAALFTSSAPLGRK
jgi:hypothetical protein